MQAKFFLIRENEITSYVLKSIKFNKNTSRIQNANFQTYSTAGSSNPNNLKKSCVISIQNKYIYISTHTHTLQCFKTIHRLCYEIERKLREKKRQYFKLGFSPYLQFLHAWHASLTSKWNPLKFKIILTKKKGRRRTPPLKIDTVSSQLTCKCIHMISVYIPSEVRNLKSKATRRRSERKMKIIVRCLFFAFLLGYFEIDWYQKYHRDVLDSPRSQGHHLFSKSIYLQSEMLAKLIV
jgi:hypothetical protein